MGSWRRLEGRLPLVLALAACACCLALEDMQLETPTCLPADLIPIFILS
jgi:hypothetical protein